MKCNFLSKECALIFATGMVAGVVINKVAKTDKVRTFAVQGLAQGMQIKDCAMEKVANIREDAEDICTEARELTKQNSECDCECECDCDCEITE